MERVILRALRPAPGDRYMNAGEMLEEAKVLAKRDNEEFVRRMNKINENGQKIVSVERRGGN